MKIIQMVPSLNYGDAVGNDVLALDELLIANGYQSVIYTLSIGAKDKKEHDIRIIDKIPEPDKDDVVIYHMCTNTHLHDELPNIKCRKILIYHNVTPYDFFMDYNHLVYSSCKQAITEVKNLAEVFDYGIAVSEFNRDNLIGYGYKCPFDVRPILIPFEDYKKPPSQSIIDKYNDGKTNIIFVGRVVPNKKHEDIIAAFSCYVKNYNPDARLFIVGSSETMESYKEQLEKYANNLGIKNVIFTGRIPFDEILAYYKIADLLLCMSEHEGFCVPLVESMFFDVPIIAYSSSAIPETLGETGILLHEKDPLVTAGVMNKVLTDNNLRDSIIEKQRMRLEDFSYSKISELFLKYLKEFIG